MFFTEFHKQFFKAKRGAFSIVTPRENYDSQITLTDAEADIVIGFYGVQGIHEGNVSSNPLAALRPFFLYPDFRQINLNLVYPKKTKAELRLYLSRNAGFKPDAGFIWFIYVDLVDRLCLGAMERSMWLQLGQNDEEDEAFQRDISESVTQVIAPRNDLIGKINSVRRPSGIRFQRDPVISGSKIAFSGFQCEVDSSHKTFIGQRTAKPFMEAHHVIPIKFQNLFDEPLDRSDNIVCVCPNCHRGFHHAEPQYKEFLLSKVVPKSQFLSQMDYAMIRSFYNLIMPE